MAEAVKTRAERALISLRQRILSGALSGGTRLFEVAVAEDLAISRTPVRAALAQLAEEGLLDRAKGGGFVVRSFDISDVEDTIELRGVLEGTAARFAAERGVTEAQLAEADEIIRNIDRLLSVARVEMEKYSHWNSRFHDLLVRLSGSAALARELARVTALPFASPSAFLDDETHAGQLLGNLRIAHEQHKAIIDAIRHREGARAESLAREHARTARRNVQFLLSDAAARREGSAALAFVRA
ncbi:MULTISPECIES: GntR family transcriptional regulator [Roseicyclus]|uniref:GntR family transcriptional regulator n=1 Tax=Roseicyclus amphidinii TaxID=3034232 RepID=UPI0024E16C95|nr:GntR family transcriptional regulator [Roseicyclus sp. Amp-Y-6]